MTQFFQSLFQATISWTRLNNANVLTSQNMFDQTFGKRFTFAETTKTRFYAL